MTLTQYKKKIKSLSKEELDAHLIELYKSSKVFRDIENSCWSKESNEDLLTNFKKHLDKVFWKERFSLGECKGVLNDYLGRTIDEGTKALMNLAFATEAVELSTEYGDFGEKYYNSLVSSAEKYLKYAKQNMEFFIAHEAEFEKLISASSSFGYWVADDLEIMLDEARAELGYYDDLDEDE